MKRQTRTISVALLRKHLACSRQVQLFEATFGDSAALTKANWNKAQGAGLDVLWLYHLLSPSALAEYYKARASALAEYNKAKASALAEYYKVVAPALAEYYKARASALYDALRSEA